MTVTEQRKFQS